MYFLPWWLMILRIFFMFLFGHNTRIPKKKKRSSHCPESPSWEHRSSGSYQLLDRRACLSGSAQDKGSNDCPHYWIKFKHFHSIQSPSLSMSYIFLHPQSPFFPLWTLHSCNRADLFTYLEHITHICSFKSVANGISVHKLKSVRIFSFSISQQILSLTTILQD